MSSRAPPRDIRLIVWNAQGAKGEKCPDKWDYLWTNYLQPRVAGCDVLGLIVKSGWAPWYASDKVPMAAIRMDSKATTFNPQYKSALMTATDDRHLSSYWVPWVADIDRKTNARCSAGVIVAQKNTRDRSRPQDASGYQDRAAAAGSPDHGQGRQGDDPHRLSGSFGQRQQVEGGDRADALANASKQLVPQSGTAIIVGDFNIDLKKDKAPDLSGWTVLRTGKPTQKSGGELDFGLISSNNKFDVSCTPDRGCGRLLGSRHHRI